jgi:hypothetical protein
LNRQNGEALNCQRENQPAGLTGKVETIVLVQPAYSKPACRVARELPVETDAAEPAVKVGTGATGDKLGGTKPASWETACQFNWHTQIQRAGSTENCQSKPMQQQPACRSK